MHRAGSDPPLWGVLRAVTGHFDPSTVFTIIADSRSFQLWQKELQMCKNLLFLNVSRCGLSTLNVLAGLTRLKYLDISHNNIVRVDQIHKLKALETLKAFANHIRRFQVTYLLRQNMSRLAEAERFKVWTGGFFKLLNIFRLRCSIDFTLFRQRDLRDLSGLPSLTALYLQKAGGREACPVCHLPEYKSRVLCLLHRESSSKDINSSPQDGCTNFRPPEERLANVAYDDCSDNPPPLEERETPRPELSLDPPSLRQPTDASPTRPTRLRVLDGMRVHLPEWNEQTDKIRRHVLHQEENARRLRAAVAEMCCTSACLPQGRVDKPSGFPQCQQKVAGLQAAIATSKETLEAFQKLKELSA